MSDGRRTVEATDGEAGRGADVLDRRLRRIASLLNAGVQLRSAIATELIRSMRAGALHAADATQLFGRALETDPDAAELLRARDAYERGDQPEATEQLQHYLHRIMVEDVPISERRLWRRRADA